MAQGYYEAADSSGCVMNCGSSPAEALDLTGMKCVLQTNCGALTMVDTTAPSPDRCVCTGTNVINAAGTDCVATCNATIG